MPVNKKYTHIFFDLDNTLWDFEKNSCQAMLTTFNHFEIEKQGTAFDSFFEVYSKDAILLQLRFEFNFEKLVASYISLMFC